MSITLKAPDNYLIVSVDYFHKLIECLKLLDLFDFILYQFSNNLQRFFYFSLSLPFITMNFTVIILYVLIE